MSDINRLSGTPGPKDSPTPKKDTPLDAEKFKKVLKPEEVSDVDPRSGRKRKRKEEEDEDEGPQNTDAPAPHALFTLHEEEKLGNLYEVKATMPQPTPAPSEEMDVKYVPEPVVPATPPPEDQLWEESFDRAVQASAPSSGKGSTAPTAPSVTTSPEETSPEQSSTKPKSKKTEVVAQTRKEPSSTLVKKKGLEPFTPPPSTSQKEAAVQKKAVPEKIIPQTKPGSVSTPSIKKGTAPTEKPLPATLPETQLQKKEKLTEQTLIKQAVPEDTTSEQPVLVPAEKKPLPSSIEVEKKQEEPVSPVRKIAESTSIQPEKKDEKDAKARGIHATTPPLMAPASPGMALPNLPPSETISLPRSAELHELYYQMVGTIIASVPNKSGDLHMIINLNSPNFEKSRFFGTQIIIERFSTAPGILHIQLAAKTETNLALFRTEQDSLQAVLKQGLPFDVRLRPAVLAQEVTYRTVRRKEGAGGETGDKKREK